MEGENEEEEEEIGSRINLIRLFTLHCLTIFLLTILRIVF